MKASEISPFRNQWKNSLEQIYHKSQRNKEPNAWLHFDIVHKCFKGSEEEVIKKMRGDPNSLIAKYEKTGFTSIQVMAMLGRQSLLQEAISLISPEKVKEALNTPDSRGWTAMHYVAVTMPVDALNYFANRGGDLTLCNNLKGTPTDLQVLCGRVKETSPTAPFTVIKDSDGLYRRISELSLEQFQTLLPPWKEFRDTPLCNTEEALLKLWAKTKSNLRNHPLVDIACQRSLNKPMEVAILPHPSLSNQVGVFTTSNVPDMSAFCPYGGTLYPEPVFGISLKDYEVHWKKGSITPYDRSTCAKTIGSSGSRINCGWPNVVPYEIIRRGSKQYIHLAPFSLSAYSELLVSYGPNIFWWLEPAKILGEEAIKICFENGLKGPSALMDCINDNIANEEGPLWLMRQKLMADRALFPLHFPVVLLMLHLRNMVPASEWLQILDNPQESEYKNIVEAIEAFEMPEIYTFCLKKWIGAITKFQNMSQSKNWAVKQQLNLWLLEQLEIMPPTKLVKALTEISAACNDSLADQIETRSFLQSLAGRLQNYEWHQDEQHPFQKPCANPGSLADWVKGMGCEDKGFIEFVQTISMNDQSPDKQVIIDDLKPKTMLSPPPVFSTDLRTQLLKQYPKSDYVKGGPLVAHFLSVYNSNIESFSNYLKTCTSESLMYRDPKTGYNAIQIALIMEKGAYVEAMLNKLTKEQRTIVLNNKCHNGWTAILLAAITMPGKLEMYR